LRFSSDALEVRVAAVLHDSLCTCIKEQYDVYYQGTYCQAGWQPHGEQSAVVSTDVSTKLQLAVFHRKTAAATAAEAAACRLTLLDMPTAAAVLPRR
jgi:hypothetical protein